MERAEKSRRLFEKAARYIPGGVNSPVRAFGAVGGTPRFIERGSGATIYDVDGTAYIDYVGSWGPNILGHGRKEVIEAVKNACDQGLTFGAPTENEVVLAQLITEMMPAIEMVRLVSSGTEAVMSAIRVARGATKRDKIIKFRGCYHGHSDGLLVKAGSGALTTAVPDSAGVPTSYTEQTLVAEYNNEESVANLFNRYHNQIAAVIVEPVAANMGVVLPKKGFLSFLRRVTKENGALLIFDEVITGFRLGTGGACAEYDIQPDLVTLGKIVGGGMPIGAYGGRRELMGMVSPVGAVYQAGTLAGNPIATAAGIATLRILREHPEIYEKLEEKTTMLANTVRDIFGEQVCVTQKGSLMSIFFTREQVVDYATARTADTTAYAAFFHYLLEHGIYIAPAQFEAMFLCDAHTKKEIAYTCEIMRQYKRDRKS